MQFLAEIFRRSDKFDEWCESAKPRATLLRLLLGLLTIALAMIFLILAATSIAAFLAPSVTKNFMLQTMNTPNGVIFALASFLLWPPAIMLGLRLAHKHRLRSLISATGRVNFRAYFFGLGFAFAVALVSVLAASVVLAAPIRNPISLETWGLCLLAVIPLLIVQTGAEELLFRGYLQRYLGARFTGGFYWAIIPTLIFGALHWNPDGYGGGAAAVMATTGLFGLALAITVARTGDLSLAMGLHMGVNMVAILLVSPPDYLSGVSLYSWPDDPILIKSLIVMDMVLIISIGLLMLWFSQRKRNSHVA